MLRQLLTCGLAVLWAATAATTPAQTVPAASSGAAAAGSPAYRSAFEGYRPFADEPPADWKASNDRVREAGGWRAYAREAAQPQQQGASMPKSPASAVDPHGAHHKP